MFSPMWDRRPHIDGGRSLEEWVVTICRTEEDTDSTRAEMTDLLKTLIGSKVTENLVVMVDNQSILREISRWVDEGGRTFLDLSVNPDIFRMVIGRLCMRIEQGTATILCKIKNHRSEPLNETTDDLDDRARTSTRNQGVKRYMDERLPLPRRGRQRRCWGAVEIQDCPMSSAT